MIILLGYLVEIACEIVGNKILVAQPFPVLSKAAMLSFLGLSAFPIIWAFAFFLPFKYIFLSFVAFGTINLSLVAVAPCLFSFKSFLLAIRVSNMG